MQPPHSFDSVPHFLEQASNFSIVCHRSRVRISQIIKSWFPFCVTVLSSISFFLLTFYSKQKKKKKSGLIFNTWLWNLLSSISKSTMYKFRYYLTARNNFPKHGSLFPWFPVAHSSLPSEPSQAAFLVSIFLLTVLSKWARLFLSCSSKFWQPQFITWSQNPLHIFGYLLWYYPWYQNLY